MEELVFAVPAPELWKLIPYMEKGFIGGSHEILSQIVQKGIFLQRNRIEDDPSYKQLISYGVISCEDSYFLFRRDKGQKETRLHDYYTLGAGGHMNPGRPGATGEEYLLEELKRELYEEIFFADSCRIESIDFAGFVNDDLIQVGKQHIGILYYIQLSDKNISILETDKLSGFWVEKDQLRRYYNSLETWSQFVVDLL